MQHVAGALAANVALPLEHTFRDRALRTGSVAGWRMVRRINIDRDGQADLKGHARQQRCSANAIGVAALFLS